MKCSVCQRSGLHIQGFLARNIFLVKLREISRRLVLDSFYEKHARSILWKFVVHGGGINPTFVVWNHFTVNLKSEWSTMSNEDHQIGEDDCLPLWVRTTVQNTWQLWTCSDGDSSKYRLILGRWSIPQKPDSDPFNMQWHIRAYLL